MENTVPVPTSSLARVLLLAFACAAGCANRDIASGDRTGTLTATPPSEVVLASEVHWEPLNPARGDASPKAGTLWGDRAGTGPTGFLVQFVDGFSSPPHIHNVSYRGVVISGLIHNDDPSAAHMWMPAGSYWTQPKGEAHITAAQGKTNVAYIEIEEGPYLVLPIEESFDSGERPINVDETNLVWLDASNTNRIQQPVAQTSAPADGPEVAFLWGNPEAEQLNGTLLKLPPRYSGIIRGHGSTFRAVVIRGRATLQGSGGTGTKTLTPGSYVGSSGASVHHVSCDGEEACIIYVRAAGTFDVVANPR